MMRPWMLSELEAPVDGHLIGIDCEVSSISTDSRRAQSGALFVALRGEHFDGHQYVQQAADCGAIAALVCADVDGSLPLLRVADTQHALGKLGAYNRQAFDGTLVAITGSSGKTTVKNMLAAVLAQQGMSPVPLLSRSRRPPRVIMKSLAVKPSAQPLVQSLAACRALVG